LCGLETKVRSRVETPERTMNGLLLASVAQARCPDRATKPSRFDIDMPTTQGRIWHLSLEHSAVLALVVA